MGILERIGLKANKEEQKPSVTAFEKPKSDVGGSASAPFSEPPQDDTFKAYIPNFLYKPPFGYPLNKNVLHLKALAKNPYIFSIIRTLKDEASTTKWEIKYKKEFASEQFEKPKKAESTIKAFIGEEDASQQDNKPQEDDIKRISDWFYNPNGNEESFGDIIGQWIVDLCEVDAAVGVKVFDGNKKFSQLFARDGGSFLKNPDIYGYLGGRDEFITPVPINLNTSLEEQRKMYDTSYKNQSAYFQYGWTGGSMPVPFGRREIIYICSNPRADSIYGRSPLEVIEEVLLTLVYGAKYNMDFYLNGNAPEGLIHLMGADPETAKAFQDRMKNKFTAPDQALGYQARVGHTYPVWGGPEANFIPFNLSAKDMEIIEQQKWFTKLVWSAFGVTPDQMGYTEDSNKAVSQTQTSVFKKKALRPLLRKIEYAINTQIMPELDQTGKFEFAFEDFDIDEETKKATLYKLQIDGGWKTAEMVAEEEGIDMNKLKAHKEEQAAKDMEMAKETNPGFLPEPKTKSEPIIKADFEKMPLDDLIKEHTHLVQVLMNDNPSEIKQELDKQKAELEKYMRQKQPLALGDIVKILNGSASHNGKLGRITKIHNNGEEDYYEVTLHDGMDLLFKENIKRIRNVNDVANATPETIDEPVRIKAQEEAANIEDYFADIKKQIAKRFELER